jgi:hypothetical protein
VINFIASIIRCRSSIRSKAMQVCVVCGITGQCASVQIFVKTQNSPTCPHSQVARLIIALSDSSESKSDDIWDGNFDSEMIIGVAAWSPAISATVALETLAIRDGV